MTQKHMNLSSEECVKVVVDYEVNHFAAYLVLDSGSRILFTTAATWKELLIDYEFQKYKFIWNLTVECSELAYIKRIEAI